MNTKDLLNYFAQDQAIPQLENLYGGVDAAAQRPRYLALLEQFAASFGEREAVVCSAPGRTELGGNHTDHQRGHVLAAAIGLDAVAVASAWEDAVVMLVQEGYAPITVDLRDLTPSASEEGQPAALVRGIAAALRQRGYQTGGFCAVLTNQVKNGSGLSSSAAFEVLIGAIFSHLYNGGSIPATELAKAGQFAENAFFGKPCGLMDQMASALGGLSHIDFADAQQPVIENAEISLDTCGYRLCIVETRGSHAALTDEYAAIPAEMSLVAQQFGAEVLSQVDEEAFYARLAELRSAVGDRALLRAMHFFAENGRVQRQFQSLQAGNFETFLSLVRASGDSSFKYLQNIYSVKDTASQPITLALGLSERILGGRGAVRVHGGGFAGTIQAFVPEELFTAYQCALDRLFGAGACHELRLRKAGGVRVI